MPRGRQDDRYQVGHRSKLLIGDEYMIEPMRVREEGALREKLTYADYAAIPEDRYRHEIIGGSHFVNPAPNTYHQTVSRRIQFQLHRQIESRHLGVVFNAPVDLQLSNYDVVQPDLLVVLQDRMHIVTESRIVEAPDLVIEILSPSTEHNDLVRKKQLYAKSGVREYWVVDPFEHRVDLFVLNSQNQFELREHGQEVALWILPEVTINLGHVWEAPPKEV